MLPKIFDSPSFQDHNIGWGSYGTEEMECNKIANEVDPVLKGAGFTVGRNDPNKDLYGVIAQSNAFCSVTDIHLSIHTNASKGKARGCTAYYYAGSEEGKRLATCIYNRLSPLTPADDRGIVADSGLLELKNTKGIAVLIEVSFHDNPDDAQWIMNNIKPIGEAIAYGVCDYAGVKVDTTDYKKLYNDTLTQLNQYKSILTQVKTLTQNI